MDKMEILCLCQNVTYEKIENAVKKGARSIKEVQAITPCGMACTSCVNKIDACIQEILLSSQCIDRV